MTKQKPLFEYLTSPSLELSSPTAEITPDEFDRLKITVEDFRFVTREMTNNLTELTADIRTRSTILRRLLSSNDIFKVGRKLRPRNELRVNARMLDFDPAHPTILISCGNYPWKGDRLPGISMQFSVQGYSPISRPTWNYREDDDVSLSDYLAGLAIAVLGTRVRRREVIKFVADKKAAHVSDKRKHNSEKAMDRAWSLMKVTIQSSEDQAVDLNIPYLEVLSVIEALATSSSIIEYIDDLEAWLATAKPIMWEGARTTGENIPPIPIKPI